MPESPPVAIRPVAARVADWRSFYRRENERPLFGFFLGSEYPVPRYPAAAALPEDRPLEPEDFAVERYCDDNDALHEAHEACGGDFIWAADAYWGIQWMECLCGMEMWCSHRSGNLYFKRTGSTVSPDRIPYFNPDGPWARLATEFLERGAVRAAGRYPFGTTRMRGISDLLSALYGGAEFVYALLDDPAGTREVCERLADLYIAFARHQLERIPAFHGGVGSFYYANWAPPGTVWHQEDAAAMLSPDLYEEHIREWNEKIVSAFPSNIVHMHSTGFVPLDAYLEMDFTAMELHIDSGGPSAEELYDRHRRILAEKPLIIWGELSAADLDWVFSRLPAAGLAVNQVVGTPAEARRLYGKYAAGR